jgi:hypothetical protein
MSDRDKKPKTTTFFVNGEKLTTTEKKLTGRAILEAAGLTPAEDYILSRDEGHKKLELDKEESIHDGERFTAKHNAPTPTS